MKLAVNNVRTVSDTKRAFYTIHTRPINSIYRRVVDELMVEMHLLAVNVDFRYDSIYALGVVTTFNRFMQGYRPEQDLSSIFEALCRALEEDPQRYRHDAERLEALVDRLSTEELIGWINQTSSVADTGDLQDQLRSITHNPNFKYSRLFAIGLFTLLERSNPDLVKDEKKCVEVMKQICVALNLSEDKVQKDLELYRSNLEKMAQARIVMEDMLKADKKKREEREQAKNAANSSDADQVPKDEASSSS